jgi:hypothetical protein
VYAGRNLLIQARGEGYAVRKEAQEEADEEAQATQEAEEDAAQEQVAFRHVYIIPLPILCKKHRKHSVIYHGKEEAQDEAP